MGSVSVSAQVRCVRIQRLNLVSVYKHTQLTWENIRRAKIQATPTLVATRLICEVGAGRAVAPY